MVKFTKIYDVFIYYYQIPIYLIKFFLIELLLNIISSNVYLIIVDEYSANPVLCK